MSINYKKPYTTLLGEIKASSLNDKIKGRNYKMYMKRGSTNSLDKRQDFMKIEKSLIGTTMHHTPSEKSICESNCKVGDKRGVPEKRKCSPGINLVNQDYKQKSASDMSQNSNSMGNKIDIKISVNYGKPNSITSNIHNVNSINNTNLSSNLSTSKSKSFYQNLNANNNNNIMNSSNKCTNSLNSHPNNFLQNSIAPSDYLNSLNNSSNFNTNLKSSINNLNKIDPLKEKLIRSLKNTIADEKIKNKKIDYNEDNNNKTNISIHKRNQSEMSYFNNNLNISLTNYEKPVHSKLNEFPAQNNTCKNININKSQISNNSFMYNPKLMPTNLNYPNSTNTPETKININQSVENLENVNAINTAGSSSSLNKNLADEFTFNRNDNDFLEAVKTIEQGQGNGHSVNKVNTGTPITTALSGTNNNRNNINNNNKSNSSHYINNDTSTNTNKIAYKNKIIHLETKLDQAISALNGMNSNSNLNLNLNPNSQNCDENHNSNSLATENILNKKFSIYKLTCDEICKLLQTDNNNAKNLLMKVSEGYNNCFQLLMVNYTNLQNDKVLEIENLNANFKNVNKKYSELYKAYQEKNEEVRILKSKLSEKIESTVNLLTQSTNSHNNQILNHNSTNNINEINTLSTVAPTEQNEISIGKNRSRMMSMIKQNVFDDLDAICFFDKISMRPNSVSHKKIPKLDLDFLNMKKKKEENSKILKKVQPLKLDDLSVHGENSKLISSSNNITNKQVNKAAVSYNSSTVKNSNSMSSSLNNPHYMNSFQPLNLKKNNYNNDSVKYSPFNM